MRKIIDGLRYDTDTATELASTTNGYYASDFRWATETLYRTPNGRLFLHGEGGPRSRWARAIGNGWTDGSDIVPLREDEAIQWLEENELYDELESLFPEAVQDA